MKKKNLLFLTVAALSLSGCGLPINSQTALERLDKIENHEFKVKDLNAITLKQKLEIYTESYDYDTGFQSVSTLTGNVECSVNCTKLYLHLFAKYEAVLTDNVSTDDFTYSLETEIWYYLKDNKFYMPIRYSDGENESKTYSIYKIKDTEKDFEANVESNLSSASRIGYDDDTLKNVKSLFEDRQELGISSKSYCFSFGDGSLTISGTNEYKDYFHDDFKISGKEKIYCSWGNYILKKNKYSCDFTKKRCSFNRTEIERKTKDTTVRKFAKISYPNLSDYTLVGN